MQNKTKTVKIFKFSVLNYPYLAFVVLSKQQLTTSFSVLRRCYQINCVQKLLKKVKFTKCNFGNTGPKTSITVIMPKGIRIFVSFLQLKNTYNNGALAYKLRCTSLDIKAVLCPLGCYKSPAPMCLRKKFPPFFWI